MRILHAADFGNALPGGFVPMIVALARRLTARGDTFGFVVPRVEGATWHPLVRETGAELYVVPGAGEAARLAHAWLPDLLHAHFFGWETALALKLWNQPARIFWHAHSTSAHDGGVRRSAKSLVKYRLIGARVERFVAVSQAVGEELVVLGAPRRRVVAIHNGIDATRFAPASPSARAQARAELGLGSEPAILFFGRNPHIKGADFLCEALAGLPGATVVAVATPSAARGELERRARVVAVERSEDPRKLFAAADVLALPSRGEGYSLVLVEAALSGLPVVASDLPALREIGAGRAGVTYVAVGDAPGLGCALRAALAAGRVSPSVLPDDSLEAWAARIEALYG
ncbi:MAG: glycosyltransferase family 4 protein [Vulcanimicrobiaceae bacterium]